MRYNNLKEEGFTLIETMVALVILTTAIIPALYLTNFAVNIGYGIRDNLTAAGLAQEGIEVVRSIRDTNWFKSQAFDTDLEAGSYRVEWDSEVLLALAGNPVLNLDNGLYTYTGGTATKFARMVTITKPNAGELKVVSQVTWTTRTAASKTIEIEEHLFDWK